MALPNSFKTLKFKVLWTAFTAVLVSVCVQAWITHILASQAFHAASRVNLVAEHSAAIERLKHFNESRWQEVRALSRALARTDLNSPQVHEELRAARDAKTPFSEFFVVDHEGMVRDSSAEDAVGSELARKGGLKAFQNGSEYYLDGPFRDARTEALGPTTSNFHDDVTLFYLTTIPGEKNRYLGARLPMDVLSDLLQESGSQHYPQSGEILLFTTREFESLPPGTVISRSRLEGTNTGAGENLRTGIALESGGVLKINQTSEFELVLRDPVSKALTSGVEQIITQGQSTLVDSAGHFDHRHIPVASSGATLTLDGSSHPWGLIASADIAEVYGPLFSSDRLSLIAILITTIIGTGVIGFVIARPLNQLISTTGQIRDMAASVHNASQAVGRSASSLASSATDQASAIAETMASMEEITAMVAANSESARQAHDRAQLNAADASLGSSVVADMQTAMRAISEQNSELAKVVEIIENISDKTRVINDIVFETKLLSFNASIEAARAGEQGKGFAVVAEEVGNLARLSGKAAQEISALIDQSTRQVHAMVRVTKDTISEGSKVTERAKGAFESISVGVRSVSQVMDQVALSSQEQQQGISQVSRAMAQMDTLTQSTAAASADASLQSKELKDAGERLREVVTELERVVGAYDRSSTTGRTAPPASVRNQPPRRSAAKQSSAPPPQGGANDGDYDVEQAGIEEVPRFDDATFG
jgi:methyl-accepting chemotaxis protein